jgi:hypothetical protein
MIKFVFILVKSSKTFINIYICELTPEAPYLYYHTIYLQELFTNLKNYLTESFINKTGNEEGNIVKCPTIMKQIPQ